jgi:hypothetical protein
MKQIITGCAIPILLFAIFFGGYAYVFLPRVEPVWLAYVLAGVNAFMLYLVLGAIRTLFQTRTIAAVLRRARQMHLPDDGKLALIQGEVVAVGGSIHTPFSNTPCVSYEYDIHRVVRTDSRQESGYRTTKEPYAFGLAKTAYVIRTSMGDVRPLGYPILDHLSKASYPLSEHDLAESYTQREREMGGTKEADISQITRRTRDYLQNQQFENAGGLGIASAFAELVETIDKETDYVRKDWKVSDPENLDGATLHETCLEPGSPVCALGKWDQARLALHAPIELIAGDLDNVQRILIANKRSSALFGLGFGILMSAIVLAFALFASPT